MRTLVLERDWLDLERLPKDIRHEINRAEREGIEFKQISREEHEKHLREYRKRKGLLMPPFSLREERRFFGVFSKNGKYCCSIAVHAYKDNFLVIQGASLDDASPYYAFSFLIYKCLELSLREGFKGLDLAGPGKWKLKWKPKNAEDSFPEQKKSLTGGRVSRLLAKIYWWLKK